MTLRPSSAPRAVSLAGATLLLLALALAGSGCKSGYSSNSSDPESVSATSALVAPQPFAPTAGVRSSRMLIPLAVGNRWDYRVRYSSAITTSSGPQPPFTGESPLAVEITGTEHIGEHDYFLQSEFDPSQGGPGQSVFRERQDRTGLFDRDPPDAAARPLAVSAHPFAGELSAYVERTVTDASQREAFQRAAAAVAAKLAATRQALAGAPGATAGAGPGEITLLRYPLFTGARWIVRDSPRFARVVVGREPVQVPLRRFIAWRIRGTSELYGPDDRLVLWYSSAGLVRWRFHAVSPATDPFGNVIGTVTSDFDYSLTGLHLVAPGGGALALSPEDE